GSLAPQDFLDAFKVERQPPGSPGFNSFEIAEMSGSTLQAAVSGADPKRWVYLGPDAPLRGRLYRVALPRRAALYPRDELSLPGPLRGHVPAGEAFEILDRYAARRRAGGLCIDDGCAPGAPYVRQPNKKY
ncbi:MAG: hypothetical protein KGL74_12020, partial [Elusimicrobia bacterium]|nr:hypothetical protein [Elusimicrobiota bacterium]